MTLKEPLGRTGGRGKGGWWPPRVLIEYRLNRFKTSQGSTKLTGSLIFFTEPLTVCEFQIQIFSLIGHRDFLLEIRQKKIEINEVLMPTVEYTSYRLPSQIQISEELFLEIRNMPKNEFDALLEIQANQMKQDFWENHAAQLKISLGILAVSGLLAFIPGISFIAAIAFVAGFFGLFSLAITAGSHSNLKSSHRNRMLKMRKIARASMSYDDFLLNAGYR